MADIVCGRHVGEVSPRERTEKTFLARFGSDGESRAIWWLALCRGNSSISRRRRCAMLPFVPRCRGSPQFCGWEVSHDASSRFS